MRFVSGRQPTELIEALLKAVVYLFTGCICVCRGPICFRCTCNEPVSRYAEYYWHAVGKAGQLPGFVHFIALTLLLS